MGPSVALTVTKVRAASEVMNVMITTFDSETSTFSGTNVRRTIILSDRKTRSRNKQKKYKDGEDSDADDGDDAEGKTREVRGHDATDMNEQTGDAEGCDKPKKEKHTSARKFFGENEDVYIMDAKQIGNIGRYLNHSCRPNMFVQNCFVDTHDLRSVLGKFQRSCLQFPNNS